MFVGSCSPCLVRKCVLRFMVLGAWSDLEVLISFNAVCGVSRVGVSFILMDERWWSFVTR